MVRRTISEVEGCRVVVTEVGPIPPNNDLSNVEADDEVEPRQMIDDSNEPRLGVFSN